MKTSTPILILSVAAAALVSACATTTPPYLTEVRNQYNSAATGQAGQLTPTELYDAKKVLDKANREFADNGDTNELRDYVYITKRKIELAEVKARTETDRRKIADAMKQGVAVRDSQVKMTKEELERTKAQLEQERSAAAARDTELQMTAQQLEAEKQARQEAEQKLQSAMKDLATVAAVKEEQRGVVITLSGSVLFPSGQYELLETAKAKLDQVADALKAQGEEKRMVVEGHTDSQGSDSINEPLSFARANAVREYLVMRGVDADKISAVGLGSRRPVVANNSAENRANNRRVEIVIQSGRLSSH